MRAEFVNIPGTTSLIKSEDLIYSRLEVKVVQRKELIAPESSEEDFAVLTSDEIVFSIKTEYHSVVNTAVADNTDEPVMNDVKDEIIAVESVVETAVFNNDSCLLNQTSAYLLLEEEEKSKVDSWVKFYRRNVKMRENLIDLREAQAEELSRNNSAADEMSELSLNKTNKTTFDSKVKILVQNLEDDDEKHQKRTRLISSHVIEAEKIAFQSKNAYDICGWLKSNVENSSPVFDKINRGIMLWLNFIRNSFNPNFSLKSTHGLNFITNDYEDDIKDEAEDETEQDETQNEEQTFYQTEETEETEAEERLHTIKLDHVEKNVNM